MRKLKFLVHWIPLALSIVALPLAASAYYLGITHSDTIIYEQGSLDSEEAADVAARALADAQAANETASTILSLLEGGSVLITLIVGAVAIVFTLNLRDLREDLEAQANANQEKIESTLRSREAELALLTEQVRTLANESRQQIERLTTTINEQLEEARNRAERSFRVLTLQMLAEQQVRARNYDTAISQLREAYELEQDNLSTNYLLGYLYVIKRQFEEALFYLRRALERDPEFAPALAALGLALRRLGDQEEDIVRRNQLWAEAELNLTKALNLEPGMLDADGESYFGTLGGLYRRQHRYTDAAFAYDQAVKVTPKSSYPIGNLAVLYTYLGRREEASELFARVEHLVRGIIEDNPGDYWARFDLAQSLLIQGKLEEAFAQYQDIITRKPPLSAYRSALSTLEFLAESPHEIVGMQDVLTLLRDVINN
ncbi:MAG: hypothetical protein CUN55_11560, partial [Phototrophicales bacterium]